MGGGNSKELTTCQVEKKSLEKDLERAKDEYDEKQEEVVESASMKIDKMTSEKETEKQKAIEKAEDDFAVDLTQQKRFYEEKLLTMKKDLEQADNLSSVAYTSLEERYGDEKVKRQKLSDEMFIIRQKLKNLDLFLNQKVRDAYRTLDTNYGKQQIYDQYVKRPQPTYQQQPYQQQPAYQQPYQQPQQQRSYTPNPYQYQQPVQQKQQQPYTPYYR